MNLIDTKSMVSPGLMLCFSALSAEQQPELLGTKIETLLQNHPCNRTGADNNRSSKRSTPLCSSINKPLQGKVHECNQVGAECKTIESWLVKVVCGEETDNGSEESPCSESAGRESGNLRGWLLWCLVGGGWINVVDALVEVEGGVALDRVADGDEGHLGGC